TGVMARGWLAGCTAWLVQATSQPSPVRLVWRTDRTSGACAGFHQSFLRLVLWLVLAGVSGMATAASDTSRVVALGGDVTATIWMLDAGDRVVGVDSTSEWP